MFGPWVTRQAPESALLRELGERLGRLRSVTAFTRAVALGYAHDELSAGDIAWHLERVLPLVERFIERVELPGFWELCDRLRDAEDFGTLAAEFEVEAEFAPHWWAQAVFKWSGARDPVRTLAAIANHFALAVPELHREPLFWCSGVAKPGLDPWARSPPPRGHRAL
jgi:hypothetical protein